MASNTAAAEDTAALLLPSSTALLEEDTVPLLLSQIMHSKHENPTPFSSPPFASNETNRLQNRPQQGYGGYGQPPPQNPGYGYNAPPPQPQYGGYQQVRFW